MIITLTGENNFGRSQALAALGDKFVAEFGDLALEKIDGEEVEFARISEALTSLPFLASRKLVVFKNPSASKDFQEEFEPLLENLPETTELVLVEARLDKRTSLYKFLKKSTDCREFLPLDASALASWLVSRAKELGGEIGSSDARFLVERAGENQQKLASELDKLILFSSEVSRENIEVLVEPTPQSKIFDLLDAAFAGNTKRAVKLYAEQRAGNVAPQEIIAMLTWQLHVLAIIKTASRKSPREIASEGNLAPFVVEKSSKLARNLSLVELKKLVRELLELDVRLKTEKLDPDEALETYLLALG